MPREKYTYFVYQRGFDPKRLTLGSLVHSIANPLDKEPYIHQRPVAELSEWTGEPIEDILDFDSNHSHKVGVNVKGASVLNLVDGNVDKSLRYVVKSDKSCRYQVYQPTNLLNQEVLNTQAAKHWLHSRLVLSDNMYQLNKLNFTKSGYPQIWMVTGIVLASDVECETNRTSSRTGAAGVTVPVEPSVDAITSALAQQSAGVDLSMSVSSSSTVANKQKIKQELVWAAQFMRLRLKFCRGRDSLPASIGLDDLVDLGKYGMRGGRDNTLEKSIRVVGLEYVTPEQTDSVDDEEYATSEDAEFVDAEEYATPGGTGSVDDDYATPEDTESPDDDEVPPMTDEDWSLFDDFRKSQTSESRKRSLLIAGNQEGLMGVANDIWTMSQLFVRLGFHITICQGTDATKEGILCAWNSFIQDTAPTDAVAIYYAGHGGMASNKGDMIQFILPTDYHQFAKDDQFRGIFSVEISNLMTKLTAVTINATIILDCCHSEHMARVGDFVPRAYRDPRYDLIKRHLGEITTSLGLQRGTSLHGNPYSVRVVAAAPNALAYEGFVTDNSMLPSRNETPQKMGRLTSTLIQIIRDQVDIGRRVSWHSILPQLQRELDHFPAQQRPQIEGPLDRILFSLERMDPRGVLYATRGRDGELELQGGLVFGVRKNDTYAIMPADAEMVDPSHQICTATVVSVKSTTANLRVSGQWSGNFNDEMMRAFPLHVSRRDFNVAIEVDNVNGGLDEVAAMFRARLGNTEHRKEVAKDDENLLATVQVSGDQLALLDQNGANLFKWDIPAQQGSVPGSLNQIIDNIICRLEILAEARSFLKVNSNSRNFDPVDVEFGTVCNFRCKPFQSGQARREINEGDQVFVKLTKKQSYSNTTVFASVFAVEFSGDIVWLSSEATSGIELSHERPYIVGENLYNQTEDIDGIGPLAWPILIPKDDTNRREAIVIIVTTEKVNLGCLDTGIREPEPIGRVYPRRNNSAPSYHQVYCLEYDFKADLSI